MQSPFVRRARRRLARFAVGSASLLTGEVVTSPFPCHTCGVACRTRQALSSHVRSAQHLARVDDSTKEYQSTVMEEQSDGDIVAVPQRQPFHKRTLLQCWGLAPAVLAATSSSSGPTSSSAAPVVEDPPVVDSDVEVVGGAAPVTPPAARTRASPKRLPDLRMFNRGSASRRRRTAGKEREILEAFFALTTDGMDRIEAKEYVAETWRIPISTLRSLLRRADNVFEKAGAEDVRRLRGQKRQGFAFKPRGPLRELEKRLQEYVQEQQRHRRPVRISLVRTRATDYLKACDDVGHHIMVQNQPFKASISWTRRFLLRMGLSWRKIKNRRQSSSEAVLASMRLFVGFLHMSVVARMRFNVDQVPFSPDLMKKYCWGTKGSDTVAVPTVVGGNKRFGTLQILIAYDIELAVPIKGYCHMIFRGKGTSNEVRAESASYHPQIGVAFQKAAWADRPYCSHHSEHVLAPFCRAAANGAGWAVFVDNLDGQRSWAWVHHIMEAGGEVITGPPGKTEAWQPMDHGVGYLLKQLAGECQYTWCDSIWRDGKRNWDRWYTAGALSRRDIRILSTHWFGEAWLKLNNDPCYQRALKTCWTTTGCATTGDRSSFDLIKCCAIDHTFIPEEPTQPYLDYHFSRSQTFQYSTMEGAEEQDDSSDSSSSSNSSSSGDSDGEGTGLESSAG